MKARIYRGKDLREISFPVGGIGAGCIGLDGYGRLTDWEIFNHPNKKSLNGYSHFAVRAEQNGRVLDARVLNRDAEPGYMGEGYLDVTQSRGPKKSTWRSNYGFGPQRELMGGMPHFRDATFEGRFPFAKIRFRDDHFPGSVSLEAFNPFIPLDMFSSSLPAAFYTVTLKNTLTSPVDYTVALSLQNPQPGLHRNTAFERDGAGGIVLTDDTPQDDPLFGQLVMATQKDCSPEQQLYWYRGSWFDDLSLFWRDFSSGGALTKRSYTESDTKRGQRDTATLAAHVTLAPGQQKKIRFVIAWYYPNRENDWNPPKEDPALPNRWKNYYATCFDSAKAVACHALGQWDALEKRTRAFCDTLYASSLPPEAMEAVGANLAVLKTPTCLRLEDGSFYGFEGCGMNEGSCEGSCTHVWNYAFALPFLFPALERSMRELDYTYNEGEDGSMAFRLQLPLGRKRSSFRSCADGLMGGIIKFYREWKICGDDEWLKKWWPKVQRSLSFAWSGNNRDLWDPQQSGVLSGRMHHTLDMELFGPNAWLNHFYLAALKAAQEISLYLGNTQDAGLYERIFRKGRAYTEEQLFNGEYFIQRVDVKDKALLERFDAVPGSGCDAVRSYWNAEAGEIKYQVGDGCGIDQVLAVWMSELAGLEDVEDPEKVVSALRSIYRHNFRACLGEHANPCRLYGLNDEAGTVMFSWPEGTQKPAVPIPYAEETMHGFEYQAASHLILHGMEEEGLRMVRAIRDRYDGCRRNPWNEMECGSNYARSMASYALLLVYSGFVYDLPHARMGFRPLKGRGRFFWSVEGAWGDAEINESGMALHVLEGNLTLERIVVPSRLNIKAVQYGRRSLRFTVCNGEIRLAQPITLASGRSLTVRCADAR